jgi:Lipocalin-like domain
MDALLNKTWVLATKDQNDEILIFESVSSKVDQNKYKLVLTENGKFIDNSVSNGHSNTITGQYKLEGNSLYTYFENSYYDSKFDIIYHDDNTLKLKKIY